MKSLPLSPTLFLFSLASSRLLAAGPPSDGGPIEVSAGFIDRLIAESHGQIPVLEAADARTAAANSAVTAVRIWDDPNASFGLWASGSGGFAASEQGNLVYGLDEKLPIYGRPELRRKVAAADASRELLAAGYETQKLRRDLAVALNTLALAGHEAALAREDLEWIDATLAAVDHRYRVGRASQVDWLKVQTVRATAADELTTKGQEREHSAFALNRLLNYELHASWPSVAVSPVKPAVYYTSRLVNAAMAAEPQLKVLRQESASAQASADLTRRERLPDVSVGVQAWQYSGDGALKQGMATVSFSVPWLNRGRYDSEWRRDQARKRASDFAAEDHALSIREELHHHIVDLDGARRQALLYRDQLIPLTEQTLSSAQAAWEQNLGSFQEILDAHRMLLADRLALDRALTSQANLFAELCFLTGCRDASALAVLAGEPPSDYSHASDPSQ